MGKKEKYFLIVSIIALPVITFLYFLKWKTIAISGDDLYIFKNHFAPLYAQEPVTKFRPVNSLLMNFFFHYFLKNTDYYYLFNIGIQAINAYVFASILNLFLKPRWLSIVISLIVALSRFSLYNITQLYNGGALEGLAMTFFLLSLYFLLKGIVHNNSPKQRIQKALLISILFANLSMYTHERYIVLFPFIILIIIFVPVLKSLTAKQRASLILISFLSILLNVALKKYVLSMPFFVGTGGTNISISFSSISTFLSNAVCSIIQINSGPEYLAGIDFSSLPGKERKFIDFVLVNLLFAGIVYILKARKAFLLNEEEKKRKFYIFLSLFILFIFLLAPAVITIRLEQRWLQASFSIFIIMAVMVISSLHFRNNIARNTVFLLFTISFLWINHEYFCKGSSNIYFRKGEKTAELFEQAINNGTIYPNTRQIYIWQKPVDTNANNEIKWAIAGGYIFKYCQDKSKKIVFTDSLHQWTNSRFDKPFSDFNKDSDQIIYFRNGIIDITSQYLKDSLRNFSY